MNQDLYKILSNFAFTINPKATAEYVEFLLQRIESIFETNEIDINKFKRWINSNNRMMLFKNARKPASAFLTAISREPLINLCKEKDPEDTTSAKMQTKLEDTEDVERDIDESLEIFRDLAKLPKIKKLYGDHYFASGRFIDKYGNVRGFFDGEGGFIYTDGTISNRWPSRRANDVGKAL